MRRFLLPLLAALSLSCGNTARPDFVIHLVDPTNGNSPISACSSGNVRVDVLQAGEAVLTSNAMIHAGVLDNTLSVTVASYGVVTQIQATVTCGSSPTLVGSTPAFIPVGYGFVNIPVGPVGTCEPLSLPVLATPRTGGHLVALHANVILIGGLDGEASPSPQIQAFDPIRLTHADAPILLTGLTLPTGLGDATVLDPTSTTAFRIVFVSNEQTAIYDATPGVPATSTLVPIRSLHAGAGAASGLVSLGGNGVAILGGQDGAPVNGFTLIAADGTPRVGTMQFPRRQPTGVLLGGTRVLVIGGQAAGEPLFELIDIATAQSNLAPAFGPPTSEERYGAVAFTNTNRSRVWVGLGTNMPDGGTVYSTSWLLSTCTPTCTIEASATFPDPRIDFARLQHHVGVPGMPGVDAFEGMILGGMDATNMESSLVDRVIVPDTGAVTIDALGPLGGNMALPRSGPAAAEIGGGVVLVGGGANESGAQNGMEVCFPVALAPISIDQ